MSELELVAPPGPDSMATGGHDVALTIRELAVGFGVAHDTAQRRLTEAGVRPIARRGSAPQYTLREAAPCLASYCVTSRTVDPDTLPPLAQRTYWQSRNERLKHDKSVGLLLEAADVEQQFAALVKLLAQFFDTLPDVLERDVSLTGEQVERVQSACDAVRAEMFSRVTTQEDV